MDPVRSVSTCDAQYIEVPLCSACCAGEVAGEADAGTGGRLEDLSGQGHPPGDGGGQTRADRLPHSQS